MFEDHQFLNKNIDQFIAIAHIVEITELKKIIKIKRNQDCAHVHSFYNSMLNAS